MKKEELKQLIKEIIESTEFQVGDKVYWKVSQAWAYRGPITISGIIEKIEGNEATVRQTTQNTYGKIVKKSLSSLTKTKKQN